MKFSEIGTYRKMFILGNWWRRISPRLMHIRVVSTHHIAENCSVSEDAVNLKALNPESQHDDFQPFRLKERFGLPARDLPLPRGEGFPILSILLCS